MQKIADDYQQRKYLSISEVARYSGVKVEDILRQIKAGEIPCYKSPSGQYRFQLAQIKPFFQAMKVATVDTAARKPPTQKKTREHTLLINQTTQRLIVGNARNMKKIADGQIHLIITSPPYFNAKMYSTARPGDLGNIHDLDQWLEEIGKVWHEVYRVLAPGRRFFLNIMNLPVRYKDTYRTLNLVGRNIDLCESVGFIFKRDIIWHKTNGVRAHFGTYPYPGAILINNMHEFILEFQKPAKKSLTKYAHVTKEQREQSKLDREFWLSIKNSDVWLMRPENSGIARNNHSAPFPLQLPIRLIRAFSFIGERVLDPFAGSGTTLLAAAQCKRDGIGYEIAPDFCTMAAERIKAEGNALLL